MFKRKKKDTAEYQDWSPHWALKVAYRVWMVIFTIAKVMMGAVATVALICVVCAFAVLGTLSEYLEGDILPTANLVLDNYEMDAPSTVYCVNSDGQIEVLQELYASTDWKKQLTKKFPRH